MLTIAYLANRFPATVEPYVADEIGELRRRGVEVIPCSAQGPESSLHVLPNAGCESETLRLQPVRVLILLRAVVLMVRGWERIAGLVARVLLKGKESPKRRLKALLHTWLGAYYAVLLRKRGVDHIHVHHGYFGSWIALVAARLLGVSFSVTLHGSDLLLHGDYLDTKLKHCRFCVTVSEYNRRFLIKHFAGIDPEKIVVSRLGVDVPAYRVSHVREARAAPRRFSLLAVGRLHPVKDHAFLVRACARLHDHGLDFDCAIAGEGKERQRLESLIRKEHLEGRVTLLGHVSSSQMGSLYRRADVVVLTSRSEGLPLVLMEAMARSKIVLAPVITGIPEIVIVGKTGFLYAPGSLEDFVEKILFLQRLILSEDRFAVSHLDWIRYAARVQVLHNFNRKKQLSNFGDHFLRQIAPDFKNLDSRTPEFRDDPIFAFLEWSCPHEDPILQ
jgi:colanic acid/amylovoran biosynthesis glycosyltransferase